jgi:hypothetical protein
MTMRAVVDTESLPIEEAQALREAIEGSGFFDLPFKIATPTPGADRFHYTMTVEDEGRRHTVDVGEAVVPPSLRALIRRLTILARRS